MKWTPGPRGNIEDLRGRSAGRRVVPLGIGGLLVMLLLSWLTGVDFLSLLGNDGAPPVETVGTSGRVSESPEEARRVDMVDNVAEDAQNMWKRMLGDRYEVTRVRLFRGAVDSGCGFAQAAMGPFYCPSDRRVYLDLSFFDELHRRFGAPGDFAQAYVIAHEIGHHVQTVTGVESLVRQWQASNPARRNALSVRMELQADCFAGVWGHHAARAGREASGGVELEDGDIEEALNAAAAIGDDRIQRRTSGRVVPERFTHGTSAERVEWFRRGFQIGEPNACNTFEMRT